MAIDLGNLKPLLDRFANGESLSLEERLAIVNLINHLLNQVNRIDELEKKLDNNVEEIKREVDNRIEGIKREYDKKLSELERKADEMEKKNKETHERLKELEEKQAELEERIRNLIAIIHTNPYLLPKN